jgi:hypothetical protein
MPVNTKETKEVKQGTPAGAVNPKTPKQGGQEEEVNVGDISLDFDEMEGQTITGRIIETGMKDVEVKETGEILRRIYIKVAVDGWKDPREIHLSPSKKQNSLLGRFNEGLKRAGIKTKGLKLKDLEGTLMVFERINIDFGPKIPAKQDFWVPQSVVTEDKQA